MSPKRAPWTAAEIKALDEWQQNGQFHPFTCGNRGDGKHIARDGEDLGQLFATIDGWRCWDCDYKQDWAHDFMFGAGEVQE